MITTDGTTSDGTNHAWETAGSRQVVCSEKWSLT